jgi:hypothetical protein
MTLCGRGRGINAVQTELEERAGRVMLMSVLMRVQAKQCGSRVVAKGARGTQSMRHQCGAVLDELDDAQRCTGIQCGNEFLAASTSRHHSAQL